MATIPGVKITCETARVRSSALQSFGYNGLRYGMASHALFPHQHSADCSGWVRNAPHYRELMRREVGHSVAFATLPAGNPDVAYDLPDGQRAFEWRLPRLVPEGGGNCVYTARATLNGEPQSLAAWQIESVEAQGPCAN